MTVSTALVATDRPARYLKQLVSQLGHQAVAEHKGDDQGIVTFGGGGSCMLTATPYGLSLVATAVDADGLAQVQEVVAKHVARFGTQDDLSVDWSEPTAGENLEFISPVVNDYLLAHCTAADEVLQDLAVTTREHEASGSAAQMQVSHDEGMLLTMLTRLVDARFAVEVGTFTGYSSLCIARGLTDGGRLLTDDRHLGMRRLNDLIATDERVESVMLPVRDGVTLARKR